MRVRVRPPPRAHRRGGAPAERERARVELAIEIEIRAEIEIGAEVRAGGRAGQLAGGPRAAGYPPRTLEQAGAVVAAVARDGHARGARGRQQLGSRRGSEACARVRVRVRVRVVVRVMVVIVVVAVAEDEGE